MGIEPELLIDEARRYVIDNQDVLRKKYGGKYIAVREYQVVACDEDRFKLTMDMKENHVYGEVVLIGTIDDIIKQGETPSQEVERKNIVY